MSRDGEILGSDETKLPSTDLLEAETRFKGLLSQSVHQHRTFAVNANGVWQFTIMTDGILTQDNNNNSTDAVISLVEDPDHIGRGVIVYRFLRALKDENGVKVASEFFDLIFSRKVGNSLLAVIKMSDINFNESSEESIGGLSKKLKTEVDEVCSGSFVQDPDHLDRFIISMDRLVPHILTPEDLISRQLFKLPEGGLIIGFTDGNLPDYE